MRGDNLKIVNGSSIAVIGGGPAGCTSAFMLLSEAKKKNLNIKVYIFEPKDFTAHYNQCAGVLSPPVEDIFEKTAGIPFPQHLIKREITGYTLHSSRGNSLDLVHGKGTYATRRILLDRFMLETAKNAGAEVIDSSVTGIEFHYDEVRIYSDSRFLRVDSVVGAFGLGEGFADVLEKASAAFFGYIRPQRALDTIITKLHADSSIIENKIGNRIHAFLLPDLKGVEFGAITPKGDHIILNIAGRDVTSKEMDSFLSHPAVKKVIGQINLSPLNYYRGRYPIKPAEGIVGDRFVAVGDTTGWVRPYKGKGINLAIETGARAAQVMINNGISESDFREYMASFRHYQNDYIYGRIFRTLVLISLKTGFMERVISMAQENPDIEEGFYKAVSGEGSYSEILKTILTARNSLKLMLEFLKFICRVH
ncbi:MAG TPA: NAD(P)/FAD-dependent oxidoreductase [bacterium]